MIYVTFFNKAIISEYQTCHRSWSVVSKLERMQMPSWSAPNESQGRKMYDHKFNDNMVRAARATGSEDI